MSYRDDLDAAVTRADAIDRDNRRLVEDNQRLTAELAEAHELLGRGSVWLGGLRAKLLLAAVAVGGLGLAVAAGIYGRVTAGYLERMFGGLSTEVLYRPENRRWALGAEVNYVKQRDSNGGLGFGEYNYGVLTGHVSGYYDFGNGFHVQVDVGRYLAGDVGATLAISREFENGWRIGAFATKTNVSAARFGEGSFDKGITLQIPFSWFTGQPSRAVRPVLIRPISRDGGARLDVTDRLYEVLRSYDETRLDAQWGRVLK